MGIMRFNLFFFGFLDALTRTKFVGYCVLIAYFSIVAAAAHSGFMGKWALRDKTAETEISTYEIDIEAILDGTARKPFVYRQLMPFIADSVESITSDSIKKYVIEIVDPQKTYTKAWAANRPGIEFQYRIIYFGYFASLLVSLFLLRALVLASGAGALEAVLAPTALILSFPYLQTIGGYFYDGIELAFLCAITIAAIRGRIWLILLLAVLATFNKESFFFFIPALYPFIRQHFSRSASLCWCACIIAASGIVNIFLKLKFQDRLGGTVEWHLIDNIRSYILLPIRYFRTEITYGLPGPRGQFFLTGVLLAIIIIRGWPYVPKDFRLHCKLALLINLPLFILFCGAGELRNLSLLYTGFVVILGFSMKAYANNSIGKY